MKVVSPTPEGFEAAAAALREGLIVAYPTETVYGLAVDPFSEGALRGLYEAKGREAGKPILVVVADEAQLGRMVAGVSPRARVYADAFWPGPLSMLMEPSAGVPEALCGDGDRICIRWTSSAIAQGLCRAFGEGVTSTSANESGSPAARSLAGIGLKGVAMGIDGGVLEAGPPSTVLDPESGAVLREGTISRVKIEGVGSAQRG